MIGWFAGGDVMGVGTICHVVPEDSKLIDSISSREGLNFPSILYRYVYLFCFLDKLALYTLQMISYSCVFQLPS